MLFRRVFFLLIALVFFSLLRPSLIGAQEKVPQSEVIEGKIVRILQEKQVKPAGTTQWQTYQQLELLVTRGPNLGAKIVVENGNLPTVHSEKYKVGEKLMIAYFKDGDSESFEIVDFVRRDSLLVLFLIFLGIVLLITRWQGLSSLVGMGISFLVIFLFILPQISAGRNPILIAVVSAFLIIPTTFYLSHGFNKKTTIAIIGTIMSLAVTALLAFVFINATKLTGYSTEEAGFLQAARPGLVNIKGLILAGVIIGVLGILDDITVAQSAIVYQLKRANEKLSFPQLYQQAMNVGKDHIASMVNTLILVYTGAALPLLLLFIDTPRPFVELINYEIIAEEIIRTLVASTGLVLAVPITTFVAAILVKKET